MFLNFPVSKTSSISSQLSSQLGGKWKAVRDGFGWWTSVKMAGRDNATGIGAREAIARTTGCSYLGSTARIHQTRGSPPAPPGTCAHPSVPLDVSNPPGTTDGG